MADLHGEVKEEWSQFDKRTYCDMQRTQIFDPYLKINGYKGRCRPARGGISAQMLALIAKSLQQLAQSHCQGVAWLYHGNPDSDGPVNSLPAPKAPQPKPQRPAASNASPAPASVDFN